jgi:aminoglycoside phosphotransferase (APT) family kinase protein
MGQDEQTTQDAGEGDETSPTNMRTPWRRDADEIGARLEKWAQAEIAPDATLVAVSTPDNGMSSESILFDIEHGGTLERLVARLAPLPSLVPVFQHYDIEVQAKAMRLVGECTDVPVPDVPHVVLDTAVLDTPFLVMRRSPGKPPTDVPPYVLGGWVTELSDDERATMQRNAVDVLARLHTLRPDTADLSFLARPEHGEDALDQHLGHERQYYEWARNGGRYPLIERTFEWLDANRPTLTGPTVLNWGDARIGNMLWDGPTPTAVLDWEMAAIGPAEVDLAWMIFLHKFFQDMAEGYGFPGLPDFMRREDMAATYTELTGRPVEALEWFEVFAALRFAVVSVRTSIRGVTYGQREAPVDPDDLIMFRKLLEQMLAGTYWD